MPNTSPPRSRPAAEQNRRHWTQFQQGQAQNVQAIAALQSRHDPPGGGAAPRRRGRRPDRRLEDALNRNLATLAGAKHFEQTVLGLAAAIHLLNARLSEPGAEKPSIQLDPGRRAAHAA